MTSKFFQLYDNSVIKHPIISIILVICIILGLGSYARNFHLDASADSLLLENDKDLKYFRSINQQYGSGDFLVIAYTPKQDLLADETLDDLRQLTSELKQLDRVESVLSILDVPLIDSPRVTLSELSRQIPTLDSEGTDKELARREFLTSPLYKNMLVSPDGKTTALQITFESDTKYQNLLNHRNSLREKKLSSPLSKQEQAELETASDAYDAYSRIVADREADDITNIRSIMANHRGENAELFLGGVAMIVTDMIDFIQSDLASFGIGVLTFLVAMLILIFRRRQWVILPLICCFSSVLFMFGFLGFAGWKVTVVSSNFTSLLLIITLSLCVHLMVRYKELFHEMPGADHVTRVKEMVRSKAIPSIYTALTTIVAFISLLTSDIRPVIDFGWMMAIGITFALLLSFIIFPAALTLCNTPAEFKPKIDITGFITRTCMHWVENHRGATISVFALIAIVSTIGISKLTVENKFIDYFKPTTEIYQGMELIDRQLGGTTPLSIILDADPDFYLAKQQESENATEDPFADDFFGDAAQADSGLSGTSYWYSNYQIETIKKVHDYFEKLPESGKVLSMATTFRMMEMVNGDLPLDNISLSVIHKKLPELIQSTLFSPYMSNDGNQLRFSIRVIDSAPDLRRDAFLKKIRTDLIEKFHFKPEQIHLTGMFVLYNNVLQSLFDSQIMTIGVVFLVIMGMFVLQFRSLRLAIIAIIPNLISAATVLGLMGLMGIPLDIMTITIAAITIGIAVDDTIHYIHRFNEELAVDWDYIGAMRRCHDSVGRAMYYTSIIIVAGFSILTLSNFNPTIYFGLFTGIAMLIAMVANLTLLALLLIMWKDSAEKQKN